MGSSPGGTLPERSRLGRPLSCKRDAERAAKSACEASLLDRAYAIAFAEAEGFNVRTHLLCVSALESNLERHSQVDCFMDDLGSGLPLETRWMSLDRIFNAAKFHYDPRNLRLIPVTLQTATQALEAKHAAAMADQKAATAREAERADAAQAAERAWS